MINFIKQPDQKVLELGGGANRHPLTDINVDIRSENGVDFVVDFNEDNWPIQSEEFDIVYSCFCLEHISWRKVPNFLKETFRVIKPGGNVIFIVPNTEAQMRYILSKPEFDGDEGSMLFGGQDYGANAHAAAFSPASATKLFTAAGFENILITPYGQLGTDMIIEAKKPERKEIQVNSIAELKDRLENPSLPTLQSVQWGKADETTPTPLATPTQSPVAQTSTSNGVSASGIPNNGASSTAIQTAPTRKKASEIYNRDYFENYQNGGFLWDYPSNIVLARKILDLNPENALELGCARGYVLKRIQDEGIDVQGLDVSTHAWMTRVCNPITLQDLTITPWDIDTKKYDLAYSFMLLEHIPEEYLPAFCTELARVSKRGLHAVSVEGNLPNRDDTRTTIKSLEWWKKILPEGHEVVDIREFGHGEIDESILKGDGKTKLNVGCAFTQFYHGWVNLDNINVGSFPQAYRYNYKQHDCRQALPYGTGVVDLIFAHHFLEHLNYEEGLRFLKDCRRVIRPDGAMRIVVPDCQKLSAHYLGEAIKLFDEVNAGCGKAKTNAQKLYSLLATGHQSFYDWNTLKTLLEEAGWNAELQGHRTGGSRTAQISRETIEMDYGGLSLFVDAFPALGE